MNAKVARVAAGASPTVPGGVAERSQFFRTNRQGVGFVPDAVDGEFLSCGEPATT